MLKKLGFDSAVLITSMGTLWFLWRGFFWWAALDAFLLLFMVAGSLLGPLKQTNGTKPEV